MTLAILYEPVKERIAFLYLIANSWPRHRFKAPSDHLNFTHFYKPDHQLRVTAPETHDFHRKYKYMTLTYHE